MQEKIDPFLSHRQWRASPRRRVTRHVGPRRVDPLAGTHLKAGGSGFTQSQQERRRPADRHHQSLGTPTVVMPRPRRRVHHILLSDEVTCGELSSFRAWECVVVASVV